MSDRVSLRRLESRSDLAPATVLAREFGDWVTERIRNELGVVVPGEADHPTEVLEEVLDGGGRVYVAEVDGEPIGVGALKLLHGGDGEIKRMFVRPSARGLGAGRVIVEQLVADARELGCRTVRLESAPFMHAAHALYRSVGFEPSSGYDGREFAGKPNDVSIFMRLDLS